VGKKKKDEAENRKKLGVEVVKAALKAHDPGTRRRIWDTEISKFYLLMQPSGYAGYYVRFRRPDGSESDKSIGSAATLTPDEARGKARKQLALLTTEGIDPVAAERQKRDEAKRAKLETVEHLCVSYRKERPAKSEQSDKYREFAQRHIVRRLGARPYKELRRSEVIACVEAVQREVEEKFRDSKIKHNGVTMARHCQSFLRSAYNWAIHDKEWVESNPAIFPDRFDGYHPTKRKGRMNETRLVQLWRRLEERLEENPSVMSARAAMLCITTLQRPITVARARTDMVDLQRMKWHVPAFETKGRKNPYDIPLSPLTSEVFEAALPYANATRIFPSASRSSHILPSSISDFFGRWKGRLFEEGSIDQDDIVLYDMRRFGRTFTHHELGFKKEVAEQVISHSEGRHISDLYDMHEWSVEVRLAHFAWSKQLKEWLGKPSDL
jgi:hypothetical protein